MGDCHIGASLQRIMFLAISADYSCSDHNNLRSPLCMYFTFLIKFQARFLFYQKILAMGNLAIQEIFVMRLFDSIFFFYGILAIQKILLQSQLSYPSADLHALVHLLNEFVNVLLMHVYASSLWKYIVSLKIW